MSDYQNIQLIPAVSDDERAKLVMLPINSIRVYTPNSGQENLKFNPQRTLEERLRLARKAPRRIGGRVKEINYTDGTIRYILK